jgi:type I restriction enzyme, S subunit
MHKHYSKYKDSGIEWVGDIPEQWEAKKLKFLMMNLDSRRIPLSSEERAEMRGDYPYYGSNGIVDQVNNFLFDGEYILLGEDGAPFFEEYKDVAFLVDGKFWVNNHAHILKAFKGYNQRFLTYALNSVDYRRHITGSTRDKLTQDDMVTIQFPVPDENEQSKIAVYLRNKTSQIDDLIAKKERMIELLKEERTAIINNAVTKGLDPDVKMKDSGIEWFGGIPAHWEIKKLKYLLNDNMGIKIGPFGSSLKAEFITNIGYKVYGQENVIADDFDIGYRYIDENKFAELSNYELFSGDVIITMMGTTGKSKVIPVGILRGIMDSHLLRLRFNYLAIPQYVSSLINDSFYIYTQLKILSKGSIMEGLNSSIVCSLLIALPPVNEQKTILKYLSDKLSDIDLILNNEQKGIELLKEYRTALISEVVTGKIDVRGEE